jgi:hypothetical protein
MKTNIHFLSYLAQFFFEWEMFQTEVEWKSKHKFYIPNTPHPLFCCLRYPENMVESDRPQMTTWRMPIACWVTEATNTHSEYVILTAFPLQRWLHEHASLLHCTYIAPSVGNRALRRKPQSTFCVSVRPWLHSDIHIWVPSFWTWRTLGY